MITKGKIKISVYETEVQLMVVDSMSELQDLLMKKGIMVHDVTNCEGITLGYNKTYLVVLVKELISHNLIAHELFHLATMVTKDIDIEDEESQAWLNGYITEHVYKILNKKNITIKL
jgi:hypothetical protein